MIVAGELSLITLLGRGKVNPSPLADCIQEANWLRSQCIHHIRKHSQRYVDFIKGEQNEQGLEQYLAQAIKQSHYIDGMLLQAVAERTGSCVVIWKVTEQTVQRYALAPAWRDGWPKTAKSSPQITIVLQNKHYTSLRTPVGEKVPRPWLRETPFDEQAEEVLSGGGLESLLGAATPSVRSSAGISAVQDRGEVRVPLIAPNAKLFSSCTAKAGFSSRKKSSSVSILRSGLLVAAESHSESLIPEKGHFGSQGLKIGPNAGDFMSIDAEAGHSFIQKSSSVPILKSGPLEAPGNQREPPIPEKRKLGSQGLKLGPSAEDFESWTPETGLWSKQASSSVPILESGPLAGESHWEPLILGGKSGTADSKKDLKMGALAFPKGGPLCAKDPSYSAEPARDTETQSAWKARRASEAPLRTVGEVTPSVQTLAVCRSFDGGTPSVHTLAGAAPARRLVGKRALESTASPVLAPPSVTAGTSNAEARG